MACSDGRPKRHLDGNQLPRRTVASVIPLLLLMATPAGAQLGTFPATEGQMVFVTPSMNVQCKFAPAGVSGTYLPLSGGPELSCDRFGPRHLRLVLGPAAAAHLFNVVDGGDCCEADNLLDYGMTWSEGPFTCHSAPKGLSCNREDHGFYIGKKVVMAY